MPQYFAIIGSKDVPLYETEFCVSKDTSKPSQMPESLKELNPFILHSALDIIEDLQWQLQPNQRGNISTGNSNTLFETTSTSTAGGFLRSTSTTLTRSATSTQSNAATLQLLKNDNCYLSRVDHFYGHVVTAYITYSGLKLVMVHCQTNENSNDQLTIDDGHCKKFYQEVHELYVKTLLNPFYTLGEPIKSVEFGKRVHSIAQKHLKT